MDPAKAFLFPSLIPKARPVPLSNISTGVHASCSRPETKQPFYGRKVTAGRTLPCGVSLYVAFASHRQLPKSGSKRIIWRPYMLYSFEPGWWGFVIAYCSVEWGDTDGCYSKRSLPNTCKGQSYVLHYGIQNVLPLL